MKKIINKKTKKQLVISLLKKSGNKPISTLSITKSINRRNSNKKTHTVDSVSRCLRCLRSENIAIKVDNLGMGSDGVVRCSRWKINKKFR